MNSAVGGPVGAALPTVPPPLEERVTVTPPLEEREERPCPPCFRSSLSSTFVPPSLPAALDEREERRSPFPGLAAPFSAPGRSMAEGFAAPGRSMAEGRTMPCCGFPPPCEVDFPRVQCVECGVALLARFAADTRRDSAVWPSTINSKP